MIVKGKNLHVMPSDDGWSVTDEIDQMVKVHFKTREEALTYAHERAAISEGEVLLHSTQGEPGAISSVALPQKEIRQAPCEVNPPEEGGEQERLEHPDKGQSGHRHDAFLGFDQSYFEI